MPHHKKWECLKPDGSCDGDHIKNRFDEKPPKRSPIKSHDLANKLLSMPNGEMKFYIVIENRHCFTIKNVSTPTSSLDEVFISLAT